MQLKLYSRAWCSWCIDAKDYLSEKGYHFQEIDVGKDRQAYEEMKQLSAQTYVPTFVAGDKVLANFDTNQLRLAVSALGGNSHPDSCVATSKRKTASTEKSAIVRHVPGA